MKSFFKRTWIHLCAIISLLSGCKPADKSILIQSNASKLPMKNEYIHVNPQEGLELLRTNTATIVLDIRTPEEFAALRIPKARNIDFYDSRFQEEIAKINRDQTILLHCASGNRSSKSLAIFSKLGFKHVYHLDGGMNAWRKASNPTEK